MMRNADGATTANIRKGMVSHPPWRRKGIFGACAAVRNVVVFAAMKRIMHQLPAPIRSLQERSGQAMIEYVICAAVLVMLTGLLALLLVTVRESGGRVLDLVASEYP